MPKEQLPNNEPVESENGPEREPATYEEALTAAKKLHAMGIKDPGAFEEYEEGSEEEKTQRIIDAWENSKTTDPEHTAKAIMLWVDAGWDDLDHLKETRDALRAETEIAQKAEDEKAEEIYNQAINALKKKIEAVDPNEGIRSQIETKFRRIETELQEKPIRAVGTIYDLLTDRTFVELITPEERTHYLELLNKTKEEQKMLVDKNFTGYPKNWKPKKIR